jgi:hypothetical protein
MEHELNDYERVLADSIREWQNLTRDKRQHIDSEARFHCLNLAQSGYAIVRAEYAVETIQWIRERARYGSTKAEADQWHDIVAACDDFLSDVPAK